MRAERFGRIPARAISCRELSARDWRVFACIALHADGSGRAFPSMATIAAMTGIGRGDIPRSVRRLEELGLLRRDSRAGHSTVNVYTVIFETGEVSAAPLTATPLTAGTLTGCQQIRTAGVSTGADLTYRTDHRTLAGRTAPVRVLDSWDGAGQFAAFWEIYPSRRPHGNPRKPAQQAFEAAVKHGIDPRVIILSAGNYAAYVREHVNNPRFVKTAAAWLNQEQWSEYQQPPGPHRLRAGMI